MSCVLCRATDVTGGHRHVPSHLTSLYTIMGQISAAVSPMTRSAHLYTIQAHHLRPQSTQYSSGTVTSRLGLEDSADSLGMVVIRWEMGVSGRGTCSTQNYMHCRLAYEVRQVSGSRSTIVCRRPLLANACLPVSRKTRCSATFRVPTKGLSDFQVWAIVVGSDHPIGLEEDGNGLYIECSALEVSRALVDLDHGEVQETVDGMPSAGEATRLVLVGGDVPCWSAAMNAMVSAPTALISRGSALYVAESDSALSPHALNEFTVVRKFRWVGQPVASSVVQFQIRVSTFSVGLPSREGAGTDLMRGEEQRKSPGVGHVGYEWRVMRCRHDCGVDGQEIYSVVAEGQLNTWSAGTETDTAGQPSANQLLAPWLWQDISASVDNVAVNDGLLICCRASRAKDDDASNILPYTVSVKNCKIFVDVDAFTGWEDLLNEGDNTPSLLYNTFNNPSLEMAR